MSSSDQEEYYLNVEADAFFKRNPYDFETLPTYKESLLEFLVSENDSLQLANVLEIGCHIGDLLAAVVNIAGSERGYGIEPSALAVAEGLNRFSESCNFIRGTAADTEKFEEIPLVDLAIVNDVFCWMSRESLMTSIRNIDNQIRIGGLLLIRDFYPDRKVRNRNKHAGDEPIYCHKILGSHSAIFEATGMYEVVKSRIFSDRSFSLSRANDLGWLENRWRDVLLKKVG
ncbi:class I SAM-dependent methyltransferase [Luminiphilus sp.]|nr:class I SAM-dependent methyltransferase [Luminiphilus sp.]